MADMQTETDLGMKGVLVMVRLMNNDKCSTELIPLMKRNNCGKAITIAHEARYMQGAN